MTSFLQRVLKIDEHHAWKTPAYYAYEQLNKYARGMSLMPIIDGPVHDVEQAWVDTWHQYPVFERVQDIEGAAVHNEEKGELSVFLINKNQKEAVPVELDLRGFEGYKLLEHTEMRTDDLGMTNTWDSQPVKPVKVESVRFENGRLSSVVKPLSWNCIRIRK
jgi:alpha-N-arabinofuranosidase